MCSAPGQSCRPEQQAVAEYLGTTQQVYSRYEKGINEIPVRHIIALCKYYGVSADYLLGLTDQNEKDRAE
ncbi:MAG TPA: helix-turn-helix transcriptional regulator [Candidatus Scubalenecus merdavium]|uniref:Helix-turn-helix transcriptional regulator n=1 Tax=Candidatus Scybalenecus merdavium TaxID=2840939 RepID=A0A9D1MW08_9FIRM|nr:helix-turn-helix transcriptional regulator [Candidatus Scubalenecus merdavium]